MRPQTAAAYLDVSTTTFREAIAPQIPAVHVTQRITAYMRVDLDAWALARRDAAHPHAQMPNPWDDV